MAVLHCSLGSLGSWKKGLEGPGWEWVAGWVFNAFQFHVKISKDSEVHKGCQAKEADRIIDFEHIRSKQLSLWSPRR